MSTPRGEPHYVTFEWQGGIPQPRTVSWTVQLSNSLGEHVRDLQFVDYDCDGVSHYIKDHRPQRMHPVREGMCQVGPQTDGYLIVAFPHTAFADLGQAWTWRAVLSVEMDQVSEFVPSDTEVHG